MSLPACSAIALVSPRVGVTDARHRDTRHAVQVLLTLRVPKFDALALHENDIGLPQARVVLRFAV